MAKIKWWLTLLFLILCLIAITSCNLNNKHYNDSMTNSYVRYHTNDVYIISNVNILVNDSNFVISNKGYIAIILEISNVFVDNESIFSNAVVVGTNSDVLISTNWYPLWHELGGSAVSAGTAVGWHWLAVDDSGVVYIAYADGSLNNYATVKKFIGSSWVTVGSQGFSAGPVSSISIALDNSGTPYVVYSDATNSGKATVYKYNGSSWHDVGGEGISAGSASHASIVFSPDDTPYVVYKDYNNSNKATVLYYSTGDLTWKVVGTQGFSPSWANALYLAFDSIGLPYVVFSDGATNGGASVMKYNGASWGFIGQQGFTSEFASTTSIAFSSTGELYMAYGASSDHGSVLSKVMKNDNSAWNQVGNLPFSAYDCSFLYINSKGIPIVSYRDRMGGFPDIFYYNGTQWAYFGDGFMDYSQSLFMVLDNNGTPYLVYQNGSNGPAKVIKCK